MGRSASLGLILFLAIGCDAAPRAPFEIQIVHQSGAEGSVSSALNGDDTCSCGMLACTGLCDCTGSDGCCSGCCDAAACAECEQDLRDVADELYDEFCGPKEN